MIDHIKGVADDKQVELLVMRLGDNFVVKSIKNTTYYIPGDNMTRDTVQQCCMTPRWTVTIVDNDLLQMVVSGVVGATTSGLIGKVV